MDIIFAVKDISEEHLGIMQLSSLLKQDGHTTRAVEARYYPLAEALSQVKGSIIAYSVPTIYYPYYQQLNKRLKQSFKFFTLFGGPHPTIVPEIIEDESIDCVCRGEGEHAFLELARKMERREPIDTINNLWIKNNGMVIKNPLRPLIQDLDSLPFVDRQVFRHSETYSKGKMHVITSRGCPYQCNYCCQPVYDTLYAGKFKNVRRRSVENVISEILEAAKKGRVSFVMFEDDLFVSSEKWISDFSEQYRIQLGLPFFCYVRADMVSSGLVRLLKSAGCVSISMGVETASETLRRDILKRTMVIDDIVRAARIIKNEGIRLETTNIIGIPSGSLEDDFETLRLNIKLKVDYSSVKILMPYPGTAIREYAIKNMFFNPKNEVTHWEYPFAVKNKSKKIKIENLRKLFAITVRFPFLLPLTKKLIALPLGIVYRYVFLLWEGYTSYFILYPTGFRGIGEGCRKYLKKFVQYN